MKVLISGFTSFGPYSENSSQIVADCLKNVSIPGYEIRTKILPVAFRNAFDELKFEIELFRPDYVLCLGLADKRQKIELEKVAINFIHSDLPDNEGALYQNREIIPNGVAAYFSTLPLEEMCKVQTPFPVVMSLSAGAYVCNYLMYRVLDYYKNSPTRAGFIHLPHLNDNHDKITRTLVSLIEALDEK